MLFVEVLLPLAVPKPYTYSVPLELEDDLVVGARIEVPLGRNKTYAGLAIKKTSIAPEAYEPKPILQVLDDSPIITKSQLQLWKWISNYYCCHLGEVLFAALPSGLKLSSETKVVYQKDHDFDLGFLSDEEYLISEALSLQKELTVFDIQNILEKKIVNKYVQSLVEKGIASVKEDLKERYAIKKVAYVDWAPVYKNDPSTIQHAFTLVSKAKKQTDLLLGFFQLSKENENEPILKKKLLEVTDTTHAQLKAVVDKKILTVVQKETSRIGKYTDDLLDSHLLTEQQENALASIDTAFKSDKAVLLHGVTGSGKTRVYIELIQEQIKLGKQVLYLLPEIALTTQIIDRLKKILGNDVIVYHSRLNSNERVDSWKEVLKGKKVVIAARSGLLLPFKDLGLIIVDEEHDASFKQQDPAPRYNGRDGAIVLAKIHKSNILLGTATPSIDSYYNALKEKYVLVEMPLRIGKATLPEIVIADVAKATKNKSIKANFTPTLFNAVENALTQRKQVILFQNRRGYAPQLSCDFCGWTQQCIHCDISLTYHMHSNNLKCHCCGYVAKKVNDCPACGSRKLSVKGFGTERIEEDIELLFKDAIVQRMDWDTVKTKNAHANIISAFEEGKTNILVGTQMVTKGLDFENVQVVGVVLADNLFYFPNFRASERAFQLLTQVAGRAGRTDDKGLVVIQSKNTTHPVLQEVIKNDYAGFYKREITERQDFAYPPFTRLIQITLKHKDLDKLEQGVKRFLDLMDSKYVKYLNGPTPPGIPRLRNYYLEVALFKLPRKKEIIDPLKEDLLRIKDDITLAKGLSQLRFIIDIDPV